MSETTDPQIAKLLARKRHLLEQIEGVERQLEQASDETPTNESDNFPRRRQRPVRAVVLDALDDFAWPAYTKQLTLYSQARFGRKIAPTRFGSLANDEMKTHLKGKRARSVWLCFGLTHNRAEPIKRLLGRSDWPLEKRIVAPTTGRVQYLKTTMTLCELALEESAADLEMMKILAADHARDLPGIEFKRGKFELERWRETALEQLNKLAGRDAEIRAEAASKWQRRLSEAQQLFGAPEVIDGGRAGATSRRAER